jgi:hydroxylamine reductase
MKTFRLLSKSPKYNSLIKQSGIVSFKPTVGVKRFSTQVKTDEKSPMFCFQCEQTENKTGCKTVGVCGKTPETAGLQDLLNFQARRLAVYLDAAIKAGVPAEKLFLITQDLSYAPYETLTNVNFDEKRFYALCKRMSQLIIDVKAIYEKQAGSNARKFEFILQDDLDFRKTENWEGLADKYHQNTIVGVENRKKEFGEDVTSLEELLMYGMKGYAAYTIEGNHLGQFDPKVFAFAQEALASLADLKGVKKDPDAILAMALRCGEMNIRVMELLDKGGNDRFGTPSPHQVKITNTPGKCILVSGHSIGDLENVLKATEGKGINVYTHGELLPAHGYPEIRKYKHLVGNYGGAWQLQKIEFSSFPGPVLVTSNCIIDPHKKYAHRLFTIGPVGVSQGVHLKDGNLQPLIDAALEEPGFPVVIGKPEKFITVGFGHNAVLSIADTIINAVKVGDIKHFYLIGGCDGHESERSYFRNLALGLPKDNVIMTMGCAKYRFNKEDFGVIKTNKNATSNDIMEIPRLLDLGQCNDSYSALKIALALAGAFKTDVNSLPLSYGISWFEQKAVVIFLTLMHLKIENIVLGPRLPAFLPPNVLNMLVEKLHLKASPL